jgi:2-dehydro-3-deoxy-D-arabinonate dehydratase
LAITSRDPYTAPYEIGERTMQLCKLRLPTGEQALGFLSGDTVRLANRPAGTGPQMLTDILHAPHPLQAAHRSFTDESLALADVILLPPVDDQEIWAAGVTYKRSQEARERESAGAARFYDLVYSAARPELFFKALARNVVGPGDAVRVRADSRWSVPEPELALVIAPDRRIVGYTIGNDVSARDIEGENPLYLPQAKVYDGSCALGPAITLAEEMPPLDQVSIRLEIERAGAMAFQGETSLRSMRRSCAELSQWLFREKSFLQGAILLTGTGIVPPDEFTLQAGDVVTIEITGIGRLINRVEQGPPP